MTATDELADDVRKPKPPGAAARRTQAERVAESDRRMLEAATRLIATQGYTATTLEAIGSEAGYSRQLVTQRFGSKDQLLQALVARHVEALRERAKAHGARLSGLAALYSEVDTYLHALDSPSVESRAFFVLMLEAAGPVPQFRSLFASITAGWEERLVEEIRTGQMQGSLRADVDARTEARLLIATLRGVRIQSMMDPERSDVPAALNTLKAALAERLLPRRLPQASAQA